MMIDFYTDIDSQIESLFQMMSQNVSYQTQDQTRTLQAIRAGTSWHDIESVKAARLLGSSRDYIFQVADFAEKKPIPKDVITDGDEVWVVYNLAQEKCWRPLGISTSFIRVHCRK